MPKKIRGGAFLLLLLRHLQVMIVVHPEPIK